MGTEYKEEKKSPFSQNKVTVIGTINAKKIEISEDFSRINFSVAVGGGKDKEGNAKEPSWYNLTHFVREDDKFANTLKEIKENEKGVQVKVKANIGYFKGTDKEGADKYYTNLTSYSVEKTASFLLPKARIELTGTVSKNLEEKEKNTTNPETGEVATSKFAFMSIKTLEGKDGGISRYHNLSTSNKENIEFLKSLKEGEQISLEARLLEGGKINISKDSQVLAGMDFSNKMRKEEVKKKDNSLDR